MANSLYVIRLWHRHCNHPALFLSVYSVLGHLVNAIELICGICTGILPPLIHMKYFYAYGRYMGFGRHIFAGTYFAVVY